MTGSKQKPFFSIITISYNSAHYIEKTIESIFAQTCTDFELIIIDGASTDNTIEIVNKYKDRIAKVVSEPDNGIASAFNKGVKLARGEWINFMNSGDCFMDQDTLSFVKKKIEDYGQENPIITGYEVSYQHNFRYPFYPARNDMHLFHRARLAHQGTFMRSDLFEKYGFFSEEHLITVDYEWHLRVLKNEKLKFLDKDICDFDVTGVSNTKYFKTGFETIKAQLRHIRTFTDYFMIVYYVFLFIWEKLSRKVMQKLRGMFEND